MAASGCCLSRRRYPERTCCTRFGPVHNTSRGRATLRGLLTQTVPSGRKSKPAAAGIGPARRDAAQTRLSRALHSCLHRAVTRLVPRMLLGLTAARSFAPSALVVAGDDWNAGKPGIPIVAVARAVPFALITILCPRWRARQAHASYCQASQQKPHCVFSQDYVALKSQAMLPATPS